MSLRPCQQAQLHLQLWKTQAATFRRCVLAIAIGIASPTLYLFWTHADRGDSDTMILRYDTQSDTYETRNGRRNLPHPGVEAYQLRQSWPAGGPLKVEIEVDEASIGETQQLIFPVEIALGENPRIRFEYTLEGDQPLEVEFQIQDEEQRPLTDLAGHQRAHSWLIPAAAPRTLRVDLTNYRAGEARGISLIFLGPPGDFTLGVYSLSMHPGRSASSSQAVKDLDDEAEDRANPDGPSGPVRPATPGAPQPVPSQSKPSPQRHGLELKPREEWLRLSSEQQASLEDLERRHLQYFLQRVDESGLVPDRAPPWVDEPLEPRHRMVSVGGMGFAFAAWVRAAQRGMITNERLRAMSKHALESLSAVPRRRGLLPHFVVDGRAAPGSEHSTVDHCLLLGGCEILLAYLDRTGQADAAIVKLATPLFEVSWPELVVLRDDHRLLSMGVDSEGELLGPAWDDYNEGILAYLMAMAGPDPLPSDLFRDLAIRQFPASRFRQQPAGRQLPLFVHQYPVNFWGADPATILPGGLNVSRNSRSATRWNREVCQAAGSPIYQRGLWGITACYLPNSEEYRALAPDGDELRGVVCPGAVLASAPLLLETIARDVEQWMADEKFSRAALGELGFADSCRLNAQGEFSTAHDILAITAGAAVLGIADARDGGLSDLFRSAPRVKQVLDAWREDALGGEEDDRSGDK